MMKQVHNSLIIGILLLLATLWEIAGCESRTKESDAAQSMEEWDSRIKKAPIDASTVLAVVDGMPIYPRDVELQASSSTEPLSKEEALQQTIDFYLLVKEARRRGYARDTAVISEYRKALALAFLEKEGTEFTKARIPLKTLQARYERQKHRFVHGTLRDVLHALVQTGNGKGKYSESDAKRISAELSRAASNATTEEAFRAAISEAAKGITGIRVEDLPAFDAASTGFVKPFVEGTFAVAYPRKRVSSPVKTKFGYHVIFIQSESPASNLTFNEARGTLEEELFVPERKKFISDLIDDLYSKGDVFIYDVNINSSIGANPSIQP